MILNAPEYQWITADGPAFGAPGLPPRWTSSEKDTVGTAYSGASRVWYTISHGILNEIYYPTIDRPQVRDLGFLIGDGETFFHEEKRDLDHTFEYIDPEALAVRIIGRDRQGRYTLTKEIISDPHQSTVLVHVRIEGEEDFLDRIQAYALLAPHVEVGGAGNSARVMDVGGNRVLLAWKDITSLAMAADCGFSRASCGYVGASDGWQDLNRNFKMDWQFDQALDGNVAMMGAIDVAKHREFTIAIGFGRGHHAAIAGAMQSLATPFAAHLERFTAQWHRAQCRVPLAAASCDNGRLLRISHSILLAHEDKTFQGAFIASASIPWGQSKGDDDLGGYHLVWTRDMVQTATALMAVGRVETALRALVYLACAQRQDGGFSQNFWVNGTPYWSGMQLDEVAFPIILAWRLWKQNALGNFDVFPFVERAAGFLMKFAPITQQERWEENSGYSPSTLAVVITGLICASELVRAHAAADLGEFYAQFADWIEANLEAWTVTDDSQLVPEVPRHFMRVRPPCTGDPYFNPQVGEGRIHLANRGPGEEFDFDAREIVDQGFLELVRYGIRSPQDPLIVDSLKVVDAILKVDTPLGACWRRYNHDGYGQRHDGGPYKGWGQGRAWPLLTGERAHYEVAAGNDVRPLVKAIEQFSSSGGMLPEQIWDAPDIPARGMEMGRPSGSAMPLAWAHAEYIKLLRSVSDGEVFDLVEPVMKRYQGAKRKQKIAIFKLDHLAKRIKPGQTLRIVHDDRFRLVWTKDGWKTQQTAESKYVGRTCSYVDVPTKAGDEGALAFTFFWSSEERWEGKNYDVLVSKGKPA
ncbi:MAG: glycoside hydrolase family 15 protein [Acidobacteriaceae bacterium]